MSAYERVDDLQEIMAPWSKQLTLQDVVYEGGFRMIRVRIKERRRFTDLELDAETAKTLRDALDAWLAEAG